MSTKTALLQRIFEKARASLDSNAEFKKFVEQNKEWLAPYAVSIYMVLIVQLSFTVYNYN